MSRPFSIGLALLFVGLQIASLYHGATYGFASHSHAPKVIIAFDTPVLDIFGYEIPEGPEDRSPDRFCDLDVYCDKLDKLVYAAIAASDFNSMKLDLNYPGRAVLSGAEWQNAVARGPPSFLSA